MTRLKELEKRLRDEPDNLGLRVALAGAFVEADRRGDAVELYRSVAIAYRAQGRSQQAIAVCRSVLELDPDDASSHALLAAMLAEAAEAEAQAPAQMSTPVPVPVAVNEPPAARPRRPVQGPLAALGAVAPDARPATPATPSKPPPEPPPLLPPDEEETIARDAALIDALSVPDDDFVAHSAVAEVATDQRGSFANLLPRLPPRRPSTSDITPLPTPVPYHVAEPTRPPNPPKLTYHDLPPSMRANMPPELQQAARLEGIARAAHEISATLLASATPEPLEPLEQVEETGEPIEDGDLIDAGDTGDATGVGDFTIANDLDESEDDELVQPDVETQPRSQLRVADPHDALDRLGTLRPTMPLGPAALRAAGRDAPKRPSVTRVTVVDDEKTQPREMPRQLRPPTAPAGPAVDALDSVLLQAVPEPRRAGVLQRFRHRPAGVGTTVIRRGESGHGLVLVVRGRLDVHSERLDGARVSLEAIGAGDYIGEISLLARAPAPAYVVAAVDCELLVLGADEFYDLIAQLPAMRAELRNTAERRMRAHDQLLRV